MGDDIADGSDRSADLLEKLARLAAARGVTVGTAESLTAGAIAARLGAAPDASSWFAGAVVAYSRDVKHGLLGVPEGPVVCEDAACAMASGARDLLGADVVVAVTGAGGPGEQDGQPPGTVWLAVSDPTAVRAERRRFDGDPEAVLEQTVLRALEMLVDAL
ncbi:CinA family protein [Rhodococcus triatomae]|nr:hypothetical protein G419_07007 [Rhodococcus triatomae BKS 15-14]